MFAPGAVVTGQPLHHPLRHVGDVIRALDETHDRVVAGLHDLRGDRRLALRRRIHAAVRNRPRRRWPRGFAGRLEVRERLALLQFEQLHMV